MQEFRVIYIDAFTDIPYTGNPCAILPKAEGLSNDQMQSIARETNLNETSFVTRSEKADFRVRYFTPRQEIPFAGHPTIATAYMLAAEGLITLNKPVTRITLEFNIGVLPVDIEQKDGKPGRVIMTQQPPIFGKTFSAKEVAFCLGLQESDLLVDFPSQVVGTGVPFLMVPAVNLDVLGKVKMDREALSKLVDQAGVPAVYVFSQNGFNIESDTHARFFDPRGTSEDPFTGSAAGAMGCYLIHYGLKKGPVFIAEQGDFINRPGKAMLEIKGDSQKIDSVRVGGNAVKVMEGIFLI